MKIKANRKNLQIFQCFSSESKVHIIELLIEKPRNIGEIADILGVSSTIVTRHINALEKAGIISCSLKPGKRGQQKICTIATNEIIVDLSSFQDNQSNIKEISIPVGKFTNFSVQPTCGLASTEKYIGMVDDPRYFSNPEASEAGIIWFETGFIEYTLPSYLFDYSEKIKSLTISLEICSEYPRYKNDHPSDIEFSLNGIDLGYWTSPGSFGGKKGMYTPAWFTCGTEYGLLKRLQINEKGTYMDGERISDVTTDMLNLSNSQNQVLKIESSMDAENFGGVTLFGKGFGNHNQDIIVTVSY